MPAENTVSIPVTVYLQADQSAAFFTYTIITTKFLIFDLQILAD